MTNKKILSALLSLSIAASSIAFTGCEKSDSEKVKNYYVLEFSDDSLTIYETLDGVLHNISSYKFTDLEGTYHEKDISNCIVLDTREKAEKYYNMYTQQENKEVIWIGNINETKTKAK